MFVRQDGTVGLCPDIPRMRYKYEVTNGDAAIDDEALKTRALSYC